MTMLSVVGYGLLSGGGMFIWNAGGRAWNAGGRASGAGNRNPAEAWELFAAGVLTILLAHWIGRVWIAARDRRPLAPSLILSLWLPLVFGTWSVRSFVAASKASTEIGSRPLSLGGLDTSVARVAYERHLNEVMAYSGVAGELALLVLTSALVTVACLWFWFGSRRKQAENVVGPRAT
jgi:hypothetical protein